MTTLIFTIFLFSFLSLLAVIGFAIFVLILITGGVGRKLDEVATDIPFAFAPPKMMEDIMEQKNGDKRFTEPVTLNVDRNPDPLAQKVADLKFKENELETDPGEWR